MAGRANAAPRGGGRMWLLGCGLLLVMAAQVAILAGVLLLPAGIAWQMERAQAATMTRIVTTAGLAMAIGPIVHLWSNGAGWAMTVEILSDIRTPAACWAAQGGAWLASELAPLLVGLALNLLAATRAARLRSLRKRLEADWGLPPAAS